MTPPTEHERAVEEIVSSTLRVEESEFDDATPLGAAGLDAESLDVIEMAETVETRLGVEIPDDDLARLETVGDVKRYVADHQ